VDSTVDSTGQGDLAPAGSQSPAGVTRNTVSGGDLHTVVQAGRIEGGVHITLGARDAASSGVWQLPPPSGFCGRADELAAVLSVLKPTAAGDAVVISAVMGLAGVGKTTLAVEAAHIALRRGWFPGGALFIDMHGYDESPVEAGQALDSLLRALGVPGERIPPAAEDRCGLYRSVLATRPAPLLVVVDNASSPGQVRPLIPPQARHRLIVTSRHTLPQLGARLLDLAVLPASDAVVLLDAALREADPADDRVAAQREEAAAVAGCCGFLPLGLQIAAALLVADRRKSVAELAAELAYGATRLLHLDDGERAVRTAFELSYRNLSEEQARLFRLLVLDPGADVATASAAALAGLSEPAVRALLEGLARAHLIERAAVRGRWRMHDLIHLYAIHAAEVYGDGLERDSALDRLFEHYLDLSRAADGHLRATHTMPVPSRFPDWEQALAWLDAERATLAAAVCQAADFGRYAVACDLSVALAEYFARRRHMADWLDTSAVAVEAACRLGDRGREGSALTNLGIVLRQLRRFDEAIDAHRRHLEICRDLGDEHSAGGALANLGVALRKARRFDEAVDACREAAAICRRLGDRHGEAIALTNLGLALPWSRYTEAVAACREAIAIFQGLGDQHNEAKALHSLAVALPGSGNHDEAAAAAREAAAMFRRFGDRRDEGVALNSLGFALAQAGRTNEAETALEQSLAILRETGDRHDEARVLANLGAVWQESGRLERAAVAYREASAIFREVGDRLREADAMDNLRTIEQR
jgi:tetratricopeptide (TPR) repeat protein